MAEAEEPGRAARAVAEEVLDPGQEVAAVGPGLAQAAGEEELVQAGQLVEVVVVDLGQGLEAVVEEPAQVGQAQEEEEEEDLGQGLAAGEEVLGPAGQMAAEAAPDRELGAEGEGLDRAQAEEEAEPVLAAQVEEEEEELDQVGQKEVEVVLDQARAVAEAVLGSCPCPFDLRPLDRADRCLGPEVRRLGRRHHRQPLHRPR